MKIFYISNSRIPTEMAYGGQIMAMCQTFSDLKINVELVVPSRKNPYFKGVNPFEYYGVKNNFKLKKIWTYDPTWLMHLKDGIYIKCQAFLFMISLFFYLLVRADKSKSIFYTRDEYLLPLLQKFAHQVIWEAHTLPTNREHYLKYWRKCHKIITISQGLKSELIRCGLNENKILVAPDGVDLKKLKIKNKKSNIRNELNLPHNKKIIMYVGHLYAWKGVDVLARAAEFLTPDEIIVFVGGNELEVARFKEKLSTLNLRGGAEILIMGHKPPTEIPFYLKAADVLVLPNSATDPQAQWTSPLKMFEYMASGVPIVASNLASIKEILNENNAVFFEPDNPEELVMCIEKVLNDKNLAEKISSQAKIDVQKYSWQKRAEQIYNFII